MTIIGGVQISSIGGVQISNDDAVKIRELLYCMQGGSSLPPDLSFKALVAVDLLAQERLEQTLKEVGTYTGHLTRALVSYEERRTVALAVRGALLGALAVQVQLPEQEAAGVVAAAEPVQRRGLQLTSPLKS